MPTGQLELYPNEKNAIISTWAAIQKKFVGKMNDASTLLEMVNETEAKFKGLGFIVWVDVANQVMADDGKMYASPIIEIVRRVVEEEGHDFERHAAEVKAGFEDGVPGVIKEDGRLVDPTKHL